MYCIPQALTPEIEQLISTWNASNEYQTLNNILDGHKKPKSEDINMRIYAPIKSLIVSLVPTSQRN